MPKQIIIVTSREMLVWHFGAKFDYPEVIKVHRRSSRSVRVHHFLPLLLYSWEKVKGEGT